MNVENDGTDKAPEHTGRWWCGDRQQWIYEPEGQERLYTQAELDAAVAEAVSQERYRSKTVAWLGLESLREKLRVTFDRAVDQIERDMRSGNDPLA